MNSSLKANKLLLGFLYVCIIVFVVTASIVAAPKNITGNKKILLAGKELTVEVADTPALRELGLSNHRVLAPNEAMLFEFPSAYYYGFWMKGMLFPIDIIWFDDNRKIVDVWQNAKPESFPEVRTPMALSRYVLEVPSGFFATNHLQKGNTFDFEN